jgi:hypothetical protein
MTTVKTNSKEFTTKVNAYILSAIDGDSYGKELNTDQDKLQFVADCFLNEYAYSNNLKRYGNYQNMFANWLMGLPSAIIIDFLNYKIIEIAKEWGSLPANATEKQEDKIISNWLNLIAFKVFKLMEKHGINPYKLKD